MFFGDYFYYGIFSSLAIWLLILIGIIVLIVYFVKRNRRQQLLAQNQVFRVAFSREDALSQLYFLLFMLFFTISLLALNRMAGEVVSWRVILFLASASGIGLGYKYKALYSLAFSLMAFIAWWVVQASVWADKYNVKYAPVLAGFLLLTLIMYVVGHYHEQNPKWKRYSFIYTIFSIIFLSGIMFYLSSRTGLQTFGHMLQGGSMLASWEIMLMLIAFTVFLAVFFIMTINKHLLHAPENLAIILFTLFALVILFIPGRDFYNNASGYYYDYAYGYSSNLSTLGTFWAAVFNVGVFLEMLGIILIGYLRKESWHVTLGVILLFVLIFVKYFDWFFTTLDKSIFFIGAGVLLFGVGFLMNRARSKVLSAMDLEPPKPNV